jgi:hypothetical protein
VNFRRGRAFRDNPDDLGELDESRIDVLLVGGMASGTTQIEMADAYSDAAIELIELAMASGDQWRLSYPILYLCRHALELYLKSIIQKAEPKHNLEPLVEQVESILHEQLGESLPTDLRADLFTLATIDPDGQSLRYATSPKGEMIMLPGEYWVSLTDLQQLMKIMGSGIKKACDRLGLSY